MGHRRLTGVQRNDRRIAREMLAAVACDIKGVPRERIARGLLALGDDREYDRNDFTVKRSQGTDKAIVRGERCSAHWEPGHGHMLRMASFQNASGGEPVPRSRPRLRDGRARRSRTSTTGSSGRAKPAISSSGLTWPVSGPTAARTPSRSDYGQTRPIASERASTPQVAP